MYTYVTHTSRALQTPQKRSTYKISGLIRIEMFTSSTKYLGGGVIVVSGTVPWRAFDIHKINGCVNDQIFNPPHRYSYMCTCNIHITLIKIKVLLSHFLFLELSISLLIFIETWH